jgi:diguanylate cyclase (GGDEF)-like protein
MIRSGQKQESVEKNVRDHRRVLLIADDEDFQLVSMLEGAGFKVVGVCSMVESPVALHRTRPQLVIAGSESRGLTVAELARILQQSEDAVPLILIGSEEATLQRRRAAMLVGAFDYYQMPTEFELLLHSANQLTKLRQTMEKLRGDADLDHLTGLANRRRFRVALTRELERWHRYGVPCALLLLDVDHMKAINDNYGHPAGDAVLRAIGETLKRVSRETDIAARLGGEEFALLCAGTSAAKAEPAANRLLEILSAHEIPDVGNITVSIGVAACPDHANSERTLYTASDAALYVAKNEGRNRVSVAPEL